LDRQPAQELEALAVDSVDGPTADIALAKGASFAGEL
jgi:hypothetical protein